MKDTKTAIENLKRQLSLKRDRYYHDIYKTAIIVTADDILKDVEPTHVATLPYEYYLN